MSHAELCVQEHALLDEEAASIKSRSRSKSQSWPADSTAKCTVEYVDGDTKFQTSSDSPDSLTSSADDPIQTVESPVDAIESSSRNSPTAEETDSAIADEEVLKAIDQLLVKRVLLAVELETQARVLFLHTMQKGSRPEVLLRADMVGRILFGAAPLLNLAYFSPCSGFRIGKSRNYISKTRIQSCDPKA